MNESQQLQIDFRTGCLTAIHGDDTSAFLRSTCSAINTQRTRGIMEAAKHTPSSQSVQAHVWATAFAKRALQWEVPLIDLDRLGVYHDEDGFISTSELKALTPGAEAQPYLDEKLNVVYKLFDLKPNGALGKKLMVSRDPEVGFEIETHDAIWTDTLEKLAVLNEAGGHITEIVGLATTGDYLIAKQPLAYPYKDFPSDLKIAENRIKAVIPVGGGLRQRISVIHVHGKPWFVGDLHERNIMRDSQDEPTIIDALIGTITPMGLKQLPWLRQSCLDAEKFRETGRRPRNDIFDNVDDAAL